MMNPTRAAEGRRAGGVKVIILLVVATVIGAGASFFVFGRSKASADLKHADKKQQQRQPKQPPLYIDLGPFLVNVESQGNLRYLKVNITLVVRPKKNEDEKEEKGHGGHGGGGEEGAEPTLTPADDVRARDTVVRVLSGQQFEELRTGPPREAAKKLLARELKGVLKECDVLDVLFTYFVMQ